jgi:hypothetical protein
VSILFSFEDDAMLIEDREDLIAVLRMRFGSVPPETIELIYEMDQLETLERLILVAANAPSLSIFHEEIQEGQGNFRIMGERFNPIEGLTKRGEPSGEKG